MVGMRTTKGKEMTKNKMSRPRLAMPTQAVLWRKPPAKMPNIVSETLIGDSLILISTVITE